MADRRRITHGLAGLLAVLVIVVYAPAGGFDYVHYDDPHYVFGAPQLRQGITAETLRWALTNTDGDYWHPTSSAFHLVACTLFGLEPGPQHLVNVGLFLATAIALYYVIAATTAAPVVAFFGAALWACHPLRVESVAWVTERGALIAGLLCVLALAAHAAYARHGRRSMYVLAFVLYLLAMLAKPTAAALPAGMLLFDLWPLGRLHRQNLTRLVLEKVPLLVIAVGVTVATILIVGRGTPSHLQVHLAWVDRALAVPAGYAWFVVKTTVPINLSPHYPWSTAWPRVWGVASAVMLVGITWWILRTRRPSLIAGWLWFLAMLLPMLAAASLRTSWVSDRYSYLPHMLLFPGVFAALAPRVRVSAGAVVVVVLAIASAVQLTYWRRSETLFAHALNVNPRDAVISYNFGVALGEQGRFAEAAGQYKAALSVHPKYQEAHVNLGAALQMLGDLDGAELHYRAALRLDPNDPDAKANLDDLLAGRSATSKPSTNPS